MGTSPCSMPRADYNRGSCKKLLWAAGMRAGSTGAGSVLCPQGMGVTPRGGWGLLQSQTLQAVGVLSRDRERSCSPWGFGVRNGSMRCVALLTSHSHSSSTLPAAACAAVKGFSSQHSMGRQPGGSCHAPAHSAAVPLPPGRGSSPSLHGR